MTLFPEIQATGYY